MQLILNFKSFLLRCSSFCADNIADESIKIKIYDFQMYFYQSFVHDLIFFLFTSVRPDDLAADFKLFIHCYQAEFVGTLKSVNCPLDDYTFEK